MLSKYYNDYGIDTDDFGYKIKKTKEDIDEDKRIALVSNSIVSSINSILEKGHKVILVYTVPENGFHVPMLIHNKLNFFNILNNKLNLSDTNFPILSTNYDAYKKRHKVIIKTLDKIQNQNLHRVYPDIHLCNKQIKNRCISNSNDKIYYYDDDHLSIYGSTFVVKDIIDIIKKIHN